MTGRSLFRVLRWVGLAAVAPVLWACQARSLETPELKPEMTFGKTFQQTINRNVDMLFLVDDSSSMRLSQDNLNRNFPTFMTTLQSAPQGLPNIHVAVISSDMGAGDGSVAGCDTTGGKQGIFQYTPRGTCTASGLAGGRDVHLGHRRRQELHRQASRTCSPASRPSVRPAAASSTSSLPSCARSAPTGARRRQREPGLPAPRRVPRDHHDHERGRLLRVARTCRCSTRARTPTSCRSSARPRTSAATSSATSATACTRAATRPTTTWPRRSPTPAARRTTRKATCSAPSTPPTGSRPSRPIRARSSSRRSRARRRPTP